MVKYFQIFHDFSQNQNGVRYIFVPLFRVLNSKTGLGVTLTLVFEAFLGESRILKYFMIFLEINLVSDFLMSLKFLS